MQEPWTPRSASRASAWSLALLGALVCASAHAQSAFSPYASVEYEHNSNLFALPDDISLVPGADPHKGDTDLKYLAGLEGAYAFGLQQITFDAEWRHFDYDHFNNLDHDEYLLDGKFLWKLASALDGKIDYRQEHLMEPFAQRLSLVLALETATRLEGTANWNIGSSWRLEGAVGENRLDAPQVGLPSVRAARAVRKRRTEVRRHLQPQLRRDRYLHRGQVPRRRSCRITRKTPYSSTSAKS